MKIFKTTQVKEVDEYTIHHEPIASIDLMERASKKFAVWFTRKYDISQEVFVFAGPGNNGGDGLAVARLLAERNFHLKVFILDFGNGYSKDCSTNLKRLKELKNVSLKLISVKSQIPDIPKGSRIIDAIFGSGLSRPVEGFPAAVIKKINNSESEVIAIDIPSGLFGEDNTKNNEESIIRANYTVSFEFPFLSFFFPENEFFIGKWKVISIGLHPEAIKNFASDYYLTDKEQVGSYYRRRSQFSHKGSNGHALIVSGCYGMMGAAVLANKACLRAGAGLVTAHIPAYGYNIIQTAVPEALISMDQSDIVFTGVDDIEKYSAVGIGPGLNCKTNTSKGVLELIAKIKVPLVIDADAINILSSFHDNLSALKENTILTPHPGEFDRLAGPSENAFQRHLKQVSLSKKFKLIIVLKGKYTITSLPDGTCFVNSTGNPGLATGGSGDVLTGIIVSLLAQGYKQKDAAVLGVYLHGLAADLALKNQSYESLLPSDVIENLGKAFKELKN